MVPAPQLMEEIMKVIQLVRFSGADRGIVSQITEEIVKVIQLVHDATDHGGNHHGDSACA